ncbi:MAG TPA: ATP-binding protein [Telluria sp.]|nr:ATP-binding protein [Telluria sp.]
MPVLNRLRLPARRLSIALVASVALATVVTLVLLTFAVLFYSAERDERWDALRRELAISADQLAVSAALPAWNFDDSQLVAIMKSGMNHRDLYASVLAGANQRSHVLLRDANGQLVEAAAAPAADGLLVETRTVRVGGQAIGAVSVYATPRFLLEDLRQRRLAIVGMILVLDIALVFSVYLLVWHLMLKPIKAVGDYAAAVKAGGAGGGPHKALFVGEIGTLSESIRAMVTLLDSRYTALRESEERLSIATHAAHIGIWDWDIVTNELVWDEQMYRQYRVRKEDFGGAYEAWTRTVLPEDLPRASAAIMQALRGECEYVSEFRIAWPDGSIRHIAAESLTFRDAAGRALRMVGVNYDITERTQAQAELLRHRNHLEELVAERTAALSVAVKEAKAASRAKSMFLATMSHELRTPLNSVIGFSHLMQGSATMSADEKHNMAIIHRSGQHLLTLINDILELSKVEAGRLTLQSTAFDPRAMLRDVLDMVRPRADQNGLALALDIDGVPHAVRADAARLRQVLLNLLSNAVKFVEQGSVTLELRGRALADGRHALAFAVRDTGAGIAPADQARIFEPFVQAEGGAREGTGLGLTIAREFVRLMGGRLELDSAPGAGSVFRFTIEAEAAPAAASDAAEVVALAPGQHGRRILLVDDKEEGRKLLAAMLAPLGFALSEAADGHAALAAVAAERPDLVFMDWRMPGLDGLEATRLLRAGAGWQPKVVMLTASAFEDERQQALAAGADAFLRKPVECDKLFDTIEGLLGLRFTRRGAQAAPHDAEALSEADLRDLAPDQRAALRGALQELNLGRVGQLLAPLRAGHPRLAAGIERMLARHQYPQLCGLIDAAERGEEAA